MSKVQYLGAGVGAGTSDRAEYQTFLAGSAITTGQWVAFDNTQTAANKTLYVIPAANIALGNPLVIGVAMHAQATTGDPVSVCIGGYCASSNVTTGVAALAPVVVDTTTGRADAWAATDISPCGTVLVLAAANKAAVLVKKVI